jgi:hypothetical protein
MSSFLDEIKNKLKQGRTELKIISGGGKNEGASNHVGWMILVVVILIVIVVVIVVVLSNNNTEGNPNLIQMDKKEDPGEIITDLSEANERIEQKQTENEQEYRDPNFTLLKDLIHA